MSINLDVNKDIFIKKLFNKDNYRGYIGVAPIVKDNESFFYSGR